MTEDFSEGRRRLLRRWLAVGPGAEAPYGNKDVHPSRLLLGRLLQAAAQDDALRESLIKQGARALLMKLERRAP